MNRTYSCKRKSRRWPLVVFYNILGISIINVYVIWRALNPNWNSNKSHKKRLCLLQLGKQLAGVSKGAIQKTDEQTRESASEPPRKKARCTICTPHRIWKRKSVQNVLKMCAKNTAILCVSDANRTNLRLE
jgi:hypothetical protein